MKAKAVGVDGSPYRIPLDRIASRIDIALHDSNPLRRQIAQDDLRALDIEWVLAAARLGR
jgi:hypothetical protein